jgi:hypothetical protein
MTIRRKENQAQFFGAGFISLLPEQRNWGAEEGLSMTSRCTVPLQVYARQSKVASKHLMEVISGVVALELCISSSPSSTRIKHVW